MAKRSLRKPANTAMIEAKFASDELSRRNAIIDATTHATYCGRRDMLEKLITFAEQRKSNAVDLVVVRNMYAMAGHSALQYWAAFRRCKRDSIEATRTAVAAVYKLAWDTERDNRIAAKAKAAAEAAGTYKGNEPRATRANAGEVIEAEAVAVTVEPVAPIAIPAPTATILALPQLTPTPGKGGKVTRKPRAPRKAKTAKEVKAA